MLKQYALSPSAHESAKPSTPYSMLRGTPVLDMAFASQNLQLKASFLAATRADAVRTNSPRQHLRGGKIDLDLEQESAFKSDSAARSDLLCASFSAALFGSSRSLSCSSSCSESFWDSQCNRLVYDHRNAAHVNHPGLVQSPAHSLPPFCPTHSCTSCAAGAPHLMPYCRIGQVADRGVP